MSLQKIPFLFSLENENLTLFDNMFFRTGDFINIGIKVYENKRFRICNYSGFIISIKKLFFFIILKLFCSHNGIIFFYSFFIYSPFILYIYIKYSLKVNHSKLYYLAT